MTLTLISFLIFGILTWTFLEYFLHRYLGHWKKGRNSFTKEHLRHHREFHYFAAAYKKMIAALVVLISFSMLLGWVFGWMQGLIFSFGLAMMYGIYELIHKRIHTHAPVNRYAQWIRKHHFYHHFKNPKMNHGVTTPFWDLIFGTLEKPEIVKIPRKIEIKWMLDPLTGMIKDDYQKDYSYIGR